MEKITRVNNSAYDIETGINMHVLTNEIKYYNRINIDFFRL